MHECSGKPSGGSRRSVRLEEIEPVTDEGCDGVVCARPYCLTQVIDEGDGYALSSLGSHSPAACFSDEVVP